MVMVCPVRGVCFTSEVGTSAWDPKLRSPNFWQVSADSKGLFVPRLSTMQDLKIYFSKRLHYGATKLCFATFHERIAVLFNNRQDSIAAYTTGRARVQLTFDLGLLLVIFPKMLTVAKYRLPHMTPRTRYLPLWEMTFLILSFHGFLVRDLPHVLSWTYTQLQDGAIYDAFFVVCWASVPFVLCTTGKTVTNLPRINSSKSAPNSHDDESFHRRVT